MEKCVCGSEKDYAECCGAFIDNHKIPSTPLELMRSRYTAFTQVNIDYIAKTMKSKAAERFDADNARRWAESIEWIELEIVTASHDGDQGSVEFLAHFYQNKKRHVLHEISEFHREDSVWYYVDGKAPKDIPLPIQVTRIGRNDPCLCGSGKKYKKCCGNKM